MYLERVCRVSSVPTSSVVSRLFACAGALYCALFLAAVVRHTFVTARHRGTHQLLTGNSQGRHCFWKRVMHLARGSHVKLLDVVVIV